MQTINDNTTELRQKMVDAGVPDFGVGVNINGAGNVNYNANIMGHEVLNTANIDRSAKSVEATYKELGQVRKDYWNTLGNASFFTEIGFLGIGYAAKTSAGYTPQYAYSGMARAEAAAARTLNGIAKGATVLGYTTTGVGILSGVIGFTVSYRSWGDYGQLGVSSLSTGLTLSGATAPIGIGIGFIDVAGGFNGFYNYLDAQQQFYNNTGGLMIYVNGIPNYLQLKR